LEKKRPGAVNIYQKRYFVLSIANNTLSYYKDKETRDKAPEDMLGIIPLTNCDIITFESKNRRFDIQVKDESEAQSDSRCFSLRALDDNSVNGWLRTLKQVKDRFAKLQKEGHSRGSLGIVSRSVNRLNVVRTNSAPVANARLLKRKDMHVGLADHLRHRFVQETVFNFAATTRRDSIFMGTLGYLLQDVELKAGEYLYRQGEKYTDVVIVSQGQLELLFEGKAITTYGARDVLSGGLDEYGRHVASCRAVGNVSAYKIAGPGCQHILREFGSGQATFQAPHARPFTLTHSPALRFLSHLSLGGCSEGPAAHPWPEPACRGARQVLPVSRDATGAASFASLFAETPFLPPR